MRRVLTSETYDESWSKRARKVIDTERATLAFLKDCESPIYAEKDKMLWWTYAGGAANLLLARVLEGELGERISADNFKLTFRDNAAMSTGRIVDAIRALRDAGRPTGGDAARMYKPGPAARLSKFAPCLTEALQQELGAREAFDIEGAREAIANLPKLLYESHGSSILE